MIPRRGTIGASKPRSGGTAALFFPRHPSIKRRQVKAALAAGSRKLAAAVPVVACPTVSKNVLEMLRPHRNLSFCFRTVTVQQRQFVHTSVCLYI